MLTIGHYLHNVDITKSVAIPLNAILLIKIEVYNCQKTSKFQK